MSLRLLVSLAGAFFFTGSLPVAAAPVASLPGQYTVTQIASNIWPVPVTINNFGQVAGTTYTLLPNGLGPTSAFLWTPLVPNGNAGTLIDLGGLPSLGASGSVVNGINDRGQVVGTTSANSTQVFLWSPDAPNLTSGGLIAVPSGASSSADARINNFGQIGFVSSIWTPLSPNGTSGTLYTDSRLKYVVAINDFGQAIVETTSQVAFLFTPAVAHGNAGTFTPIQGPSGSAITRVVAINANGTILGMSGAQGFLWTPISPNGASGTVVTIPLPSGFADMTPVALNAAGDVLIALRKPSDSFTTSYLYRGGTFYALTAIAPPFVFAAAVAMNDVGQFLFLANQNLFLVSPEAAPTPVPPNPVGVNISSQPSGLAFTVTGANCSAGSYTTPRFLLWTPGSSCTISFVPANGLQGGIRYAFASWQDGVTASSRVFVAPSQVSSYSASFKTQYLLYPLVSSQSAGTISGGGWYDANSTATITAMPANGYRLAGWLAPAVPIAGTNSATVPMTSAQRPGAVFAPILSGPPTNYSVVPIATNSTASSGGAYVFGPSLGKPINNYGQVVGASAAPVGAAQLTAFLWTPLAANGSSGSVTDVGGIPGNSFANGINDRGQVVGASDGNAFLWSPNTPNGTTGTSTAFLGAAADGANAGIAINTIGEIGGRGFNCRNFLWLPVSPNAVVGSPANDPRFCGFRALNDFGQAVFSSDFNAPGTLFTPSAANGTTGTFTSITEPDGSTTFLVGINNQGKVLGSRPPFLWTPDAPNGTTGTSTAIPLPVGIGSMTATALNNAGDVVGTLDLGGGLTTPFLYTNGTMYDLGSSAGMPAGAEPAGINDRGQIVLNANGGVYLASPTAPLPPPGPNDVPVTIASTPAARVFTVNGSGCRAGTYVTPATLSWTPGSGCTVAFLSPNSTQAGTRYVFTGWTDGTSANPRVIATPGQPATYTANFNVQYFLTTVASPPASGTLTGAGWYNPNDSVTLTQMPASGFRFVLWNTTYATSTQTSVKVTVTSPLTVTAFFQAILNPPPTAYTVTQIAPQGTTGALNNYGQVVGTAATSPKTAFLWTPNNPNGAVGGLTILPGLLLGAPSDNIANGINDRGQVVGTTSATYPQVEAFLWTPNSPNATSGAAVAILGSEASGASSINSFGQIIGNRSTGVFLWTPAVPNGSIGTAQSVPAYSNQPPNPTGINDFGEVIIDNYGVDEGMPFSIAGTLFTPSTPNGATGTSQQIGLIGPTGIDNNGTIVGQGGVWTPNAPHGSTGTAASLPPPGGFRSAALTALNNKGQFIGSLQPVIGVPIPVLYTNGAFYDLSQIPGVPAGAAPVRINDHGQILLSANYGIYLLTPQLSPPPAPLSVNPPAGSASGQTMVFTFTDPRGWQDLDVVNILINNFLDGRQACYLAYSQPLNVLYLVNDAGTALLPGMPLVGSGGVGNSQCSVSGAGSFALGTGSTLTLTLNLAFGSGFAGNKVTYLAVRDASQNNSGWQPLGTWNVPGQNTFPSAVSVSPSSGTGSSGIFTFAFSDTKGVQDLGVVNILINNSLDGRQACYLAYSRPLNVLYLVNDTGTGLLPGLTPGGTGSVSNGQCTLRAAGSSATSFGNNLTLMLDMTFQAPFRCSRVMYLAAQDLTDANTSGWQALGTWTVQ